MFHYFKTPYIVCTFFVKFIALFFIARCFYNFHQWPPQVHDNVDIFINYLLNLFYVISEVRFMMQVWVSYIKTVANLKWQCLLIMLSSWSFKMPPLTKHNIFHYHTVKQLNQKNHNQHEWKSCNLQWIPCENNMCDCDPCLPLVMQHASTTLKLSCKVEGVETNTHPKPTLINVFQLPTLYHLEPYPAVYECLGPRSDGFRCH
jgi:hypothetical protein